MGPTHTDTSSGAYSACSSFCSLIVNGMTETWLLAGSTLPRNQANVAGMFNHSTNQTEDNLVNVVLPLSL